MKIYTVKVDYYGNKYWYRDGSLHREDGPAVEYVNGDKQWWLNGNRHREDGPAIEQTNGKSWWLNGNLHREDGPAVEYANGDKEWYRNNLQHREDGPAVEFVNGLRVWRLNGKDYTEQQWRTELANRNKTCNGRVVEVDGVKYKLVAM